jgi:hypothetical protein
MKFENWIEIKEQNQVPSPGQQPMADQQVSLGMPSSIGPGQQPQQGQGDQEIQGLNQPQQGQGDQEIQGLNQAVKMHLGRLMKAMDKQAWNKERRIEFVAQLMGDMAGGMGLTLPEVGAAVMRHRKAQ